MSKEPLNSDQEHFLALGCAFYNHKIPDYFFRAYCESVDGKEWTRIFRTNGVWDEPKYALTLARLEEESLLFYTATSSGLHFTLLPHGYDIARQKGLLLSEFTREALLVLAIYIAQADESERPMDVQLHTLEQLDYLLEQDPAGPLNLDSISLISTIEQAFWLSVKYHISCRYKEAEWLLDYAISNGTQLLGPNAPKVIWAMDQLASVYIDSGNLKKAETYLLELLEIKKHIYGSEDPMTIACAEDLGLCYCLQSQYKEGQVLFERTLDLPLLKNERILVNSALMDAPCSFDDPADGPPLNPFKILNNRAMLLADQGRYGPAEKILRSILANKSFKMDLPRPQVLSIMKNLGMVLLKQGQDDGAYELLSSVAAEGSEYLGALSGGFSPLTLSASDGLAVCLCAQKRYAEAIETSGQAYRHAKLLLGDDHPETLHIHHNLGYINQEMKNFRQAEAIYQDVLARRNRVLGTKHWETKRTRDNLAWIHEKLNQTEEIEALL